MSPFPTRPSPSVVALGAQGLFSPLFPLLAHTPLAERGLWTPCTCAWVLTTRVFVPDLTGEQPAALVPPRQQGGGQRDLARRPPRPERLGARTSTNVLPALQAVRLLTFPTLQFQLFAN